MQVNDVQCAAYTDGQNISQQAYNRHIKVIKAILEKNTVETAYHVIHVFEKVFPEERSINGSSIVQDPMNLGMFLLGSALHGLMVQLGRPNPGLPAAMIPARAYCDSRDRTGNL